MTPFKDREHLKDFIRRNYGKISQRKMSESLQISPISITRLVRELGMTNKAKASYHGPAGRREGEEFFSFRNHYELFIGNRL